MNELDRVDSSINCRIGSLENKQSPDAVSAMINCRIGSLENYPRH